MKKYDVVVVGAGPAGASAARMLAKSKISVLVLDKGHFPRCKPCAGGLTVKTLMVFDSQINLSINEMLRYTANSVVASYKNQIFHRISGEKVLARMVERSEFDHFLINKAVECGAEFCDGTRVAGIEWDGEEFCVKTEEGVFRCSYLVGADGAGSIVNKVFKIVEKDLYGFAVETNCPGNKRDIANFEMTFDFGAVPGGYLWIFPKDGYLCVGAYTTNKKMGTLKKYLSDYIEMQGLIKGAEERFSGHIIPFYGINYRQPDFPCILVGDAAGFGDFFSGEGIYYAVKSGILAAEAIRSSLDAGSFQSKELQKRYDIEIISGLKIAYRIGKAFYRHFPYTFNVFMSHFPASILYETTSRGITYEEFFSKSPVILKSIIFNKSKISTNVYYNHQI